VFPMFCVFPMFFDTRNEKCFQLFSIPTRMDKLSVSDEFVVIVVYNRLWPSVVFCSLRQKICLRPSKIFYKHDVPGHNLSFRTVVPKLFRAVTQIKVSVMSYYLQKKFFAFQVEKFFCSDRS